MYVFGESVHVCVWWVYVCAGLVIVCMCVFGGCMYVQVWWMYVCAHLVSVCMW